VVIPEITRTIKSATKAIDNVGRLSATVNREVEVQSGEAQKTQEEVRETLIGIQNSIQDVKETTQGLAKTGERLAEELGADVTRSTRKVDEVIEQLRVSAQHMSIVTANAEQASQSMPAIAKGLEKVEGRAPTYQKIGTILAIGLGLANIFR
jgi:methyl-accepting chemotaxis protein